MENEEIKEAETEVLESEMVPGAEMGEASGIVVEEEVKEE